MATPSQLVRFLRDCHEADNREMAIADLFHRKVRHLHFFESSESLLTGLAPRFPLETKYAETVAAEAALHQKEKVLLYCVFPIVGRPPVSNDDLGDAKSVERQRALCAPLLFYPARVTQDGDQWSFEIDAARQRLNFPVLARLAGNANTDAEDSLRELPSLPFNRERLHALIATLHDSFPEVDGLPLVSFPKLMSRSDVQEQIEVCSAAGRGHLACLPACALALVSNSPDTRGVLFELAQIAQQQNLPQPLQNALGTSSQHLRRRKKTGYVPAVLSQPQQRMLQSAGESPLTLVIGPPGTGKSYTIAALAVDQMSRGQSVLIASQMNHAIDVIADKIVDMIGPVPIIRGGRGQQLRELKTFLQQLLQGILLATASSESSSRKIRREVNAYDRRLQKLQLLIERQFEWEQSWGDVQTDNVGAGWFTRMSRSLRAAWLSYTTPANTRPWEVLHQYKSDYTLRNRRVVALHQTLIAERLEHIVRKHRGELNTFLKSIRARSHEKQSRLLRDLDLQLLLRTFPIWMSPLADLSEILPLKPGLFDVAIIDEATQCDISSCLPLFYRARRVVVVGDPNQLRHVSFLSRDRQQELAAKHRLDSAQQDAFEYRNKSILDLLNEKLTSQDNVVFLDEHFRSRPHIISFSNKEFYADGLKLMTQRPHSISTPCIELTSVAGERSSSGANRIEAEALLDKVAQIISRNKDVPDNRCPSIGVLSPFRDQVDHLSREVQRRFSLTVIQRHRIMAGTAHTFQGEERDVMFLSLAVDPDSHGMSFRFLNNPNVFNVAITRARNLQCVFSSVPIESLNKDSLLRRYLQHVKDFDGSVDGQDRSDSGEFADEVGDWLGKAGFQVWQDYAFAGQSIDLLAVRDGQSLGVDLIGSQGKHAKALNLERYRTLQRAGLTIFPLPHTQWSENPAACQQAIIGWAGNLERQSGGHSERSLRSEESRGGANGTSAR